MSVSASVAVLVARFGALPYGREHRAQGVIRRRRAIDADQQDVPPRFDENGDGDPTNDGNVWHSNWVVLGPDEQCGAGALKVIDIPEGDHPRLPKTWPGLPMLIDSPGWQPLLFGETVEVQVPFDVIKVVQDARFDGVTAGLRVDANLHSPLLCVAGVFDVAAGGDVGAVARELGVKQPTVTDSVSALERKGLVTRQRMEQDLLRTTLQLTEAGREIVAALASSDDEIFTTIAGLAADEVTATYVAVLGLIKRFVDTGYIDVARICLTCRYLTQSPVGSVAADRDAGGSEAAAAGGGAAGSAAGGRHCTLLDMALPDQALRINCAEHEAVGSQR